MDTPLMHPSRARSGLNSATAVKADQPAKGLHGLLWIDHNKEDHIYMKYWRASNAGHPQDVDQRRLYNKKSAMV